jgi:membrane-associated phospholipid phosphatase
MNSYFRNEWRASRCVTLLLIIATAAVAAHAQSPSSVPPVQSPTPGPSPTPSLERQFFRNILRDQRAIWTSPLRIRGDDARYLAPLGVSTVALIVTDKHTAGKLDTDNDVLIDVSKGISEAGALYTTGGIAAAFYFIGRRTGNARARETGLLSAEALANGVAVYKVLKLATQRPRPREKDGHGRFFDGGQAFPSGHAVNAWAVATVIANEYKDRPLVRYGSYSLATAVSLSRFSGRSHFLSDVLVGSVIGYGIGHYVYKTHHDPSLDSQGGMKTRRDPQRFLPFVAPVYEPRTRSHGLMLVWSF